MKRNTVVWLLAIVFLATVPLVGAQQPGKLARIGYLSSSGTATSDSSFAALRQGLRDLGHIEGKDIVFEYRGAEGEPDRVPGLVAELVQLKVDVLFCPNFTRDRCSQAGDQGNSYCHGF